MNAMISKMAELSGIHWGISFDSLDVMQLLQNSGFPWIAAAVVFFIVAAYENSRQGQSHEKHSLPPKSA